MKSKHELYTMKISRELEVEITTKGTDPRDIANEIWFRLTEGCESDEAVSLVGRMYDDCVSVVINDDYLLDDEVDMPMKLSGETRWLALRDVPRISYYDGIIDSQTDFVKSSSTTEVLLQGDAVLAIIHCDNNVWMGDVYVAEGRHFERNHKKSLRDQIEEFVQGYLYAY